MPRSTIRRKYELEIVKVRNENPTWSKEKIARYLEKEKGIKLSPSTVYRVLKAFRLIERTKSIKQKTKQHSKNRRRTKISLRARYPSEVVQIDLKHIVLRGVTGLFHQLCKLSY